ncbi:protein-L-isoaspartate O-methyltransferase family protein [Sandaracinobacteroides saxicola]|uniref:Protein-L-isoaspartate O-methyltransferase n=1 Tax=Sandaracinobacteroides saxicola TaxID=2759707 RepID=A0A7G5IJW7_9SPHN|nr:protein-L-isoaspartate O-methyltransferase [Sandaracinobacteroides saxicola]QMW23659.1 protein-L-isoaspartate O-methyltransferase [Sandaracinobacteroides saxicola]
MIHSQLQVNGVIAPRLVAAFGAVAREAFGLPGREALAYVDAAVPVGGGRFMMAPLSIGHLFQALDVRPDERMLVVGGGYGGALAARLAGSVTVVESDAALAARTRALLPGVAVVEGDMGSGAAEGAPFDVMLVDGAIARLPDALADQLAEGGRMAAIMPGSDGVLRAMRGVKAGGRLVPEPFAEAAAPMLPGFSPAPAFRF